MTMNAPTIAATPLFVLTAEMDAPITAHESSWGSRRLIPVRGGSFAGERLRGRIGGGGADYQLVRPDGVVELDVRLVLRTEEGEHLAMTAQGIRSGPPELVQRAARGEAVDPALFYFRELVRFETSSERLRWMNGRLFIGAGRRLPSQVELSVYELL